MIFVFFVSVRVCVCSLAPERGAEAFFYTISGNDRRHLLCCEPEKLLLSFLTRRHEWTQTAVGGLLVSAHLFNRGGMSHQSCYVRLLCDVLVCFALIMSTSDLSAYISKVDFILIIVFMFPNRQSDSIQTTYHVCHCYCPRSFHISVY